MKAIQHDVGINGSAEDIFSALTTEKGLNAWWTKEAAGYPKMGAEYVFYFGAEWDLRAEVIDYWIYEIVDYR
jgi:uncharacterized protein YndB with AHSA1/START domain